MLRPLPGGIASYIWGFYGLIILAADFSWAGERDRQSPDTQMLTQAAVGSGGPAGWFNRVNLGYLHQFKTETDAKDEFDVNRFAASYSIGYSFSPALRASLSIGYTGHDYSFDGKSASQLADPWGRVDSFRLSLPLFWHIDEQWNAVIVPAVRTSVESGASFDDGVNGGVIGGVSYRFSDRLSIGPGLGVLSQLEDSVSVFPILLVDWKITDRLSLETGRGFAATQGPGLTLAWKASDRASLFLLGRYERLRFRLDNNAFAPDGIGEDSSFPLLLGMTYNTGPLRVSLTAGAEFGGKLRIEDSGGDRIATEDYEVAPVLGITASARF